MQDACWPRTGLFPFQGLCTPLRVAAGQGQGISSGPCFEGLEVNLSHRWWPGQPAAHPRHAEAGCSSAGGARGTVGCCWKRSPPFHRSSCCSSVLPWHLGVRVGACCKEEEDSGRWVTFSAQAAGGRPWDMAAGTPSHGTSPLCVVPCSHPLCLPFSSQWGQDHHPGRERLRPGPERVHGGPWHRQRADGGCPRWASPGTGEQGCVPAA